LRWRLNRRQSCALESSMSRGLRRFQGAAGSGGADLAFRFGLFGPGNVRSYPTFPQPIRSELSDTVSESDPGSRSTDAGRLKLPKPPGARAFGMRAYKTPAKAAPRWGLCFCLSETSSNKYIPSKNSAARATARSRSCSPRPTHLEVSRHRGVLETQALPATLIASNTRRIWKHALSGCAVAIGD
jgi:hypothetical protein